MKVSLPVVIVDVATCKKSSRCCVCTHDERCPLVGSGVRFFRRIGEGVVFRFKRDQSCFQFVSSYAAQNESVEPKKEQLLLKRPHRPRVGHQAQGRTGDTRRTQGISHI